MLDKAELTQSISRLVEAKRVTTAFINGAPGSGKSTLLLELSKEMQSTIKNSFTFGPYSCASVQALTSDLSSDFIRSAFLEKHIPLDLSADLIGSFNWFRQNLQTTSRQILLILIDLQAETLDLDSLRSWLSSIRSLEQSWQNGPARLLILVTGFWSHNQLTKYYREIQLSFPYTSGYNYFSWDGITLEQMDGIIARYFSKTNSVVPHSALLNEITNGHPGAAEDILCAIPKGEPLTIASLIMATKVAASSGETAKRLVKVWSYLSDKSRAVLRHLLLMRQIPLQYAQSYYDEMYGSGLLMTKVVAGTTYGVLRSWFIECVARFHLSELGIEDTNLNNVDMDNMIPCLVSVNQDAYRIVNEIENISRNFVIVRISKTHKSGEPILQNRGWRYDERRKEKVCANERATDWRDRSQKAGLPVELNPLIAYLSISDLPILVKELADEMGSDQWRRIAQALDITGDIRDAVMHNQIIDDAAYTRLYELRSNIYNALRPE